MRTPVSRRRDKPGLLVFLAALVGIGLSAGSACDAAIVAFLTESRAATGQRFQSDLMFAGSADMIGDEVEIISLDIIGSTVNAQPLVDFAKVRFDAAPRFAPWQAGEQFGAKSGFESVVLLDAFAADPIEPFVISDTDAFTVGTFTVDYGGLGLGVGDTVVLDILGRNDGSATRTTSIGIRPSGSAATMLVNPDFTSPAGTQQSSFTITAIPEPGAVGLLAIIGIGAGVRRRRR